MTHCEGEVMQVILCVAAAAADVEDDDDRLQDGSPVVTSHVDLSAIQHDPLDDHNKRTVTPNWSPSLQRIAYQIFRSGW